MALSTFYFQSVSLLLNAVEKYLGKKVKLVASEKSNKSIIKKPNF